MMQQTCLLFCMVWKVGWGERWEGTEEQTALVSDRSCLRNF
jgi:hypothetical protein